MKIAKILSLSLVLLSLLSGFDDLSHENELKKEAINACLGKDKKDKCSIYINGKDRKGICESLADKEYQICLLNDKMNLNENTKNDLLFTPILKR